MIANVITLSRIIFGGLAAYFILTNQNNYALISVIIGAITDFFDGYVARRTKTTALGQILDPIADKTFALLILFAFLIKGTLTLYETILLLIRDILILPLLPLGMKNPKKIKSRLLGKTVTTLQCVFLILLFVDPTKKTYLLYVIAVLSVGAALDYYKYFLRGN